MVEIVRPLGELSVEYMMQRRLNCVTRASDRLQKRARISTERWKPLTPEDAQIYNQSKQMRRVCKNLTEGQRKFFDRVNRQVFHRGVSSANQLLRIAGWAGRGAPRQAGD